LTQSGVDALLDVLAPIKQKQLQFLLRRDLTAVAVQGANLPAIGAVGGLPGFNNSISLAAQVSGQHGQLG